MSPHVNDHVSMTELFRQLVFISFDDTPINPVIAGTRTHREETFRRCETCFGMNRSVPLLPKLMQKLQTEFFVKKSLNPFIWREGFPFVGVAVLEQPISLKIMLAHDPF